ETDIQEKDKKKAKNESQIEAKVSQSQKVNPDKVKSQPRVSLCESETQAYRHEWQRQDIDNHATRAIMRIQALEAGARVDTLEDIASRLYGSFVHHLAILYGMLSTMGDPQLALP
ncbi:hypothetical protein Tco_1289336, partial [Tanacetum coccineum]